MPKSRLTALLLALLPLAACSATDQPPATDQKESATVSVAITDLKEGSGPAVAAGQAAVVHYTGWLYDAAAPGHKGRKFDSSHDRNQPFEFPLGAGRVIRGWDQGVQGMKVGGQRTLVIPAHLGYGPLGAGEAIPPNAPLLFEVELVGVN